MAAETAETAAKKMDEAEDVEVDMTPTAPTEPPEKCYPRMPPPCTLCKKRTATWEAALVHNWEAHQRLVLSASTASHEQASQTHPCLVCGLGSGVVFPSRDALCDHLFEHLFKPELLVPSSSAPGRAAAANGAEPRGCLVERG